MTSGFWGRTAAGEATVGDAVPTQAAPSPGGGGPVVFQLEGIPQVYARLQAHSVADLEDACIEAFGFRSSSEFEVLRSVGQLDSGGGRPGMDVRQVRVLSRPGLQEARCLGSLFADLQHRTFSEEVVYSQLAELTGAPLLRLHRVMGQACGAAVARWFGEYIDELAEVAALRDVELREAAARRVWSTLQARVDAVFPNLLANLPAHLQRAGADGATPEDCLAGASRLFSRVLDEARLRVLPLRSRRVISGSTCWAASQGWPGTPHLLRVRLSEQSPATEVGARHVLLVPLGTSGPAGGVATAEGRGGASGGATLPLPARQQLGPSARASGGLTGHDLYYQVTKFFGLAHAQVVTSDGVVLSAALPQRPLQECLPSSTDGLCVDLTVSAYEPVAGSFDQLYHEVLRILGPRRFLLDHSYRLQLPCCEEEALTTQGNTIVMTVILIPLNYLEGKQMYLFRSPRFRQCKAAMRTFDEFKEILQALVQVYGFLSTQLSPTSAERMRACAEGAPGQTPLAPFEASRRPRISSVLGVGQGCAQARHSAMGLLGGLHAGPPGGYALAAQWWLPEEMADLRVLHDCGDFVSVLSSLGTLTGDVEVQRVLDVYGLESAQTLPAQRAAADAVPHWWPPAPHRGEAAGDLWADPWSIAVGGLIGVLFGLLDCVYSRFSEQRHPADERERAAVLSKVVKRGAAGLSVSTFFHFFGRLMKRCLPECRYSRLSKRSIPVSQAAVFLGTLVWALCSHRRYVEPRFLSRLCCRELNLAECHAAGMVLTSGLACSFSVGGWVLGAHMLGGSWAGPAAFMGSLMPIVVTLLMTGLDWWQDRARRKHMKAAALQTLGLPEPSELGADVFRPMLASRYKMLASYSHPDKNDGSRCDTTTVFSQIRLAKEILEQELRDYQFCPRDRLRRLFAQMVALCGYRRDRFVSEHSSGVIMYILEDGAVEGLEGGEAGSQADIDEITTVESRSLSATPTGSPRSSHSVAGHVEGHPATPPTVGVGGSGSNTTGWPWVVVTPSGAAEAAPVPGAAPVAAAPAAATHAPALADGGAAAELPLLPGAAQG